MRITLSPWITKHPIETCGAISKAFKQHFTIDPGLFAKIEAVRQSRLDLASDLNSEQIRTVERFNLEFIRSGAKFNNSDQEKYAKIVIELSELLTKFNQNVMSDETNFTIELMEYDLVGLSATTKDSFRQAAFQRGKENYVLTLSRSLMEPFLT